MSPATSFNHFPSKQDLATALVERYAAADAGVLADISARAERLSADPLQQLLLFVGLLADEVEEGIRVAPGCLFASFCYERELIDEETRTEIAKSMLLWRTRIRELLDRVVAHHPPRLPVDLDEVADQATIVVEGSYVLVRALGDATIARAQLSQLRNYLELLFAP